MDAPFVEMDATCLRFDERAIADPLFGSVHDPIYQGAGPLGQSGVPQPRGGRGHARPRRRAVSRRDRRDAPRADEQAAQGAGGPSWCASTAPITTPGTRRTPAYIHDIFQHGLPADFRLIGATTRSPADIPPAPALALYGDILPPAGARGTGAGRGKRCPPRRLHTVQGGCPVGRQLRRQRPHGGQPRAAGGGHGAAGKARRHHPRGRGIRRRLFAPHTLARAATDAGRCAGAGERPRRLRRGGGHYPARRGRGPPGAWQAARHRRGGAGGSLRRTRPPPPPLRHGARLRRGGAHGAFRHGRPRRALRYTRQLSRRRASGRPLGRPCHGRGHAFGHRGRTRRPRRSHDRRDLRHRRGAERRRRAHQGSRRRARRIAPSTHPLG